MNRRQRSEVQSLQRTQEFLAAHPLASPPANYTRQVQALADAIVGAGTQTVTQQASDVTSRRVSRNRSALVQVLRVQQMIPLRRIARALLTDVPGIEQQFAVPGPRANRPHLIATAKAMRQHAEPYATVFIENGRPDDFLTQFDSAIQQVEDAGQDAFTSARQHGGATAAIKANIARGRQAVKYLDAIIRGLFATDAATLAEWKMVKRIDGQGSSAGIATPDATAPSVAAIPAGGTVAGALSSGAASADVPVTKTA